MLHVAGLKCQCLPPNVAQVTPGAPQNTCLLPCSDANASRVSSDACTCNASFIPDIDAPIVFGFIGPVCVTSSPGMGGYCDATTVSQVLVDYESRLLILYFAAWSNFE